MLSIVMRRGWWALQFPMRKSSRLSSTMRQKDPKTVNNFFFRHFCLMKLLKVTVNHGFCPLSFQSKKKWDARHEDWGGSRSEPANAYSYGKTDWCFRKAICNLFTTSTSQLTVLLHRSTWARLTMCTGSRQMKAASGNCRGGRYVQG